MFIMKHKFIFFIIIAFALTCLSSCKKLVDNINTDPNNPQDANAQTMLTGVELADVIVQEGECARRSGMWSGYFSGQLFQYQNYQNYNVIANDYSEPWSFVFASTIKNARLMRQKALAANNIRLSGVSRAIEAHAAGTAVALWGNIPFTQVYNEAFPNPAYEGQAVVYDHLQKLLDTAITELASPSFVSFATQDIFYLGDAAKWTQACYTLKARFYMHTKQYALALAAAQNGISANASSLVMTHVDNPDGANLYSQFMSVDRAGYMSAANTYAATIINPAGAKYRGNTKTNETARFRYLYRSATDVNYNSAGGAFYKTTAFPLVTYSENLLIKAEAEARLNGFTAGLNALNAYRAFLNTGGYLTTQYAVPANYKYDPYVAADFATGGIENSNNPFVTYALTANGNGVSSGPGAGNITPAPITVTGFSAPVYRPQGLKLTGNANGDSTTAHPNWGAEGTATTINSTFSGITFNATTRYVQFDITVAAGTSYALQNLSVPITVTGAGTLNASVAYSTDNWATFTYVTPSGNAAEAISNTAPLSAALPAAVPLTSNKISVRLIIFRKAASVGNFAIANVGPVSFTLLPLPAVSSLTPEKALLKEILEERYVTFFGQVEGFNDVRRTFTETDVRVPVPPNTGASFPQRFLYPQTEIDRNSSTPNPIPGIFVPTPVNQ
jgi:hypothetical protein